MRSIVLDRSFLQASSASRIESLCDTYRVIMCESLFFEMLTADKSARQACFSKLPDRDNPVEIVGQVGTLMRHEIEKGEPASPAERLVLVKRFAFNPGLRTGEIRLNKTQRAGIREWETDQLESETEFVSRYSISHTWFPELASYVPGSSAEPILAARKRVSTDLNLVAGVYDQIRRSGYPNTMDIGPAWALFRWLQVQLLYVLEYIRRYGPARSDVVSKRVSNDVIDSQYAVTALLADGLATGDGQLANIYQDLKPHGELLHPAT